MFRREAGNPACPVLSVQTNLESADRIVCVTPRTFVIQTAIIDWSFVIPASLFFVMNACPP